MIYQQQSCTIPRCTSWVFKPILQSLETLPTMPHIVGMSTPIQVGGDALDSVRGRCGVTHTSPRDSINLLPAIPHGYHHTHAIVNSYEKSMGLGIYTHTHTHAHTHTHTHTHTPYMMQAGIYMIYQNTYVKTMGVVTPTMYGVFI